LKKYRSNFERKLAKQLEEAKIGFEYEKHTYKLYLPVKMRDIFCEKCGSGNIYTVSWYTPDWFLDNGIVVESKGKLMLKDRAKATAMLEQYPEVDYRMVFMRDNKISTTSKTRYSDWAERQDISYYIGSIPERWLK
jgi:hypothetical protein